MGNQQVSIAERFHVHVNAITIDAGTRKRLVGKGFRDSPFDLTVDAALDFTPHHHFSFKTDFPVHFRNTIAGAKTELKRASGFMGYIEGEYLLRRSSYEFSSTIGLKLRPGFHLSLAPARRWRESELHIAIRPRSVAGPWTSALRDCGFLFTATASSAIFTAQGNKTDIGLLFHKMEAYFQDSHPCGTVVIKEERSAGHWASKGYFWHAPQVRTLIANAEPAS